MPTAGDRPLLLDQRSEVLARLTPSAAATASRTIATARAITTARAIPVMTAIAIAIRTTIPLRARFARRTVGNVIYNAEFLQGTTPT